VIIEEIEFVEHRFRKYSIPAAVSFCYPENAADPAALLILAQRGY
jgi:hypothetical protein